MAKYEKIDFGQGQDTNTGDNLYQAFTKVNDAFDGIESDIANIDLSEFAKNEDLQEFENETNQKIADLESNIEDSLVLEKAPNRGIYLKNRDESKYTPIGTESIDLSISPNPDGWLKGAKTYAVAIGKDTGAGNNSVAIGNFVSNINGQHAVAIGSSIQNYNNNYSVSIGHRASAGENSVAIGDRATSVNKGVAIGETAKAFGLKSVSFGDTLSNAAYCLAIGRYNNRGGQQTAWSNGSEIFIVGNGTSESNRSNAYQLNNNGTSTQWGIASYGADYSANFTANSLVSKKYVDDKIANIDVDVDLTNYYIKSEIDTKLNTVGQKTLNATAIGFQSQIVNASTAYGMMANALGLNSVAVGTSSYARGNFSSALGAGLQINNYGATAIGVFNKFNSAIQTDLVNGSELFVVGNGLNSYTRSNAYELFNNGTSVQYGIASYSTDFSTSFTENSLVSKKYVDDKIANIDVDVDLSQYYTKDEIDGHTHSLVELINQKAYTTSVYTKVEIDDKLVHYVAPADVYFKTQTYAKAEVYNRDEIDVKLSEIGQTDITQAGVYPNQQTRIGSGAMTTNQWSSAFGYSAKANNQLSTAIGGGSESNRNAIAIGCMAYAPNDSIIIGNEISTFVDTITAIGVKLVPKHKGEILLGRFNKIADNQVSVIAPTNHLFTIANGTSVSARSNAYELYQNGTSLQYGVAGYGGDYSANFTDNSLITKKYVDDKINNNFLINEVATVMDKATLNANYSDKNVGFVLYCTHEDLQTKYVKLSLTEWTAEPYFLVN
ncbi:hypothetical protein [Paenimyroides baculatum]|uniref:Trimeric autotransporter adhesin YadA-like head domain-containing protein n=1 Tax=Paenimyroides baculatum TaxID=2608000 RepID=A0A5M6CH36_9FLAO|nr:hypothetical protein [Paenimyroides baculatum]KAA5534296.1 hypothetical protein F0460_09315 [Paenimyroides baculatum]